MDPVDSEAQLPDARMREFQAIYRGEFAFVWSTARRLGVPPAVAEDVAQEVFLTAYRRLDHLRYEVSPRGWLYGVTRKVASRYRRGDLRRARRLATLAAMTPPAVDAPHPRHEVARKLERMLERLGPATRQVWELTELLGMSGPEIAGELALPLNTVYSRLRLARTQLQELAGGSATIAAWAEELRRQDAPPPRAARQTWAALLPVLGTNTAAPVLGTSLAARVAFATTLICGGGAVTLAAVSRDGPDPDPAPVSARAAVAPAAPTARPSGPPAPPPPAPAAAQAPVRTARAAAPPGQDDRLGKEVALLDAAHAALANDDPGAALAWVDVHARDFPRGALLDAREAARIDALCQQGRGADAEAAARRLLAQRPTSPVTQRFDNFRCAR